MDCSLLQAYERNFVDNQAASNDPNGASLTFFEHAMGACRS